jgi:hypothetical protein
MRAFSEFSCRWLAGMSIALAAARHRRKKVG